MLREVKLKEDEILPGIPIRNGQFYGISHRIWLLLTGALSLLGFTRLLFTTTTHSNLYTTTSSLTARDYLNASTSDPAPFEFCPAFGPNDEVAARRGQWGLLKSRIHMGSGARVQRVIQKGMAGLPVTISILGGSVSACHGAGDDLVASKCYPAKFFDWWNSVFPHPANELTNGAQRRSDSSYFSYCHMHHLPDQTDLVILEFDAADPNDPQWLKHYELLVRSILTRADQPAVIILGHFAPQVQAQAGFAGPELLHTIVAQFYDVPHISAKGLIYHDYLANPEQARKTYYADPMLANPSGHDLIADVLISYFQGQICAGWAATMGHAFDVPYMGSPSEISPDSPLGMGGGKGVVPRGGQISSKEDENAEGGSLAAKMKAIKVPHAMLGDRPSDILRFREVQPFCVSANDLINPLPPSHFFGSGWLAHHPGKGSPEDEKHFWFAEVGGSKFRVPVVLSAGDVAIYYIQQPEDRPAGKAACWVDDNVANAVELTGNADVGDLTPTLTMIDSGVAAGSHYVECNLLGPAGQKSAPFKMLGIFGS